MEKLAQLESGQSFILFFHEYYVQELFALFFSRKYQFLFCCRSSVILPDQQISKQPVPISALQISIIPLPVTTNRKIKKPPVKLNFRRSQ